MLVYIAENMAGQEAARFSLDARLYPQFSPRIWEHGVVEIDQRMIHVAAVSIMALRTRCLIKDDMRFVRIKAFIVEDARPVMALITEGVRDGTLGSGSPVIVQFQNG